MGLNLNHKEASVGIVLFFLTKKECGVLCEICETWYHAKCEKVQDDTYEFLKRDEWFIGFVKIAIRDWLKCLRP